MLKRLIFSDKVLKKTKRRATAGVAMKMMQRNRYGNISLRFQCTFNYTLHSISHILRWDGIVRSSAMIGSSSI